MTKGATTDAAASPATGADGAGVESLALDAAADQLASLSVSGETEGEHKNDNETRPNADVLVDDPDLWKPSPLQEDCPVCMVPLPIANDESAYYPCCGMIICDACVLESSRAARIINSERAKKELPPLKERCAFCRTPDCGGNDYVKQLFLRMEKGDCNAYFMLGGSYREGKYGLPKDESKALELFLRAAELGSTQAMALLGSIYDKGTMGVKQDKGKSREYYEHAAKRGDPAARTALGLLEIENNNIDLAIRHWKIAAETGHLSAMKILWKSFYQGELSKDDLEDILRAHKKAIDERNSDDRERYSSLMKANEENDEMLIPFCGVVVVSSR